MAGPEALLATLLLGATPATMAGVPVDQLHGRGAAVPFTEYEAENAAADGVLIGPDRRFATLAAEATGRRAVRLERAGQFVEFTLARPANAMVVRYAIPDDAEGQGLDAALQVSADGAPAGAVALTSRYGWVYGRYPFSNRPADGAPHHFYDEARLLFGRTLPAGAKVRLALGADRPPWVVVDLADFELVPPPKTLPSGALSVAAFGADPSGGRDASAAIQRAIDSARTERRTVWLPAGTYRVTRHLVVDRVQLAGAGVWWSVLRGPGVGVFGRTDGRESRRVVLRDFAIMGEVTRRDDHAALAGIGGSIGGGSLIEDLWIQHTKGGVWLDGPSDGVTLRRLRILDQAADGVNFHGGVSHSVVEDSFVRNSGDDGLAMWSRRLSDHDDAFRRDTVIAPILANGIAIYGGRDIEVSGNLVADTLIEGGGLHLANRFRAVPLAGRIRVEDNLVLRSGSYDPHWGYGIGALWLDARDAPISARIEVERLELDDSACEAIQVHGQRITGLSLNDLHIDRSGGFALQLQAPGSARFSNVMARGLGAAGVDDCDSGFRIIRGGGNSGWDTQVCAPPATACPEALREKGLPPETPAQQAPVGEVPPKAG